MRPGIENSQIMDSKMDSGYLAPGETLEEDYDVLRELLPEEVLGIMDQLLCHEVAWHKGHPLSQTLFTSIYLDRLLWPVPATLEEAQFDRRGPGQNRSNGGGLVSIVLRAYCLGLVKACDRVVKRVSSEYYYEEEDFVTQLYNRKLLSNVESEEICKLLNDATVWLRDHGEDIKDNVREALLNRLIFRRDFLSALDMDSAVIQKRYTESLLSSVHQIKLIQESIPLGKPVEESFSPKIQRRLASTVPPRPIIKLDPQDAILFLNRFCRDAIDIQQILDYRRPHDLQNLVWTLQSRKPQPSVYIRSLTQSLLVNEMRILGTTSFKQFCYDDLADLVLPSNKLLDPKNEDVELPSDPRFQIAKHMDNFVLRVAQPFVDTYRTTCLNRCRIRRTLCHSVIDWDHLQAEAEDLDVQLRALTLEPPIKLHGDEPTYAYPLSSWAYHQKLRQLRLILQLGFELSIYSPEELPGMYWYLSHICSTHLSHLDRIRSCLIATDRRASASPQSASAKTAEAERKREFERTFKLLDRLSTELIVIDAFAIALHALYTLLRRHNLLRSIYLSSSEHYSSDKLRYELRMRPFFSVSLPEYIPFDLFEQEVNMPSESDEAVLERGLCAVAEAKKGLEQRLTEGPYLQTEESPQTSSENKKKEPQSGLEADWAKDVKDSLRAAIAASISIGTLKKALKSASSAPSEKSTTGIESASPAPKRFDKLSVEIPEVGSKACWHDWWIVPQLSEAPAAASEKGSR